MNLPDLNGPNQLWVGDITYISIREVGFGVSVHWRVMEFFGVGAGVV